jgi:hypothetical protein
MFLVFPGVHNIIDEETVRILVLQEGSAKNATEGNKSEEKEVIIKDNHRCECEQNGLKTSRVNNLPVIQNYSMDLTWLIKYEINFLQLIYYTQMANYSGVFTNEYGAD